MTKTALAAILALTASTSFAQTDATTQEPGNAGPANLCRELVAFMQASPPEPVPPPKSAESEQKGGSAQDDSGQSGPAHAAPEPKSARTTESGAQNAQQKSGLCEPAPAQPGGTSKESVITVAEAARPPRANATRRAPRLTPV